MTPYAGVIYDFTQEISSYVSYTEIFNPQHSRDRNGKFLDPLTGKNYELGIKGEFRDGMLNMSLAYFNMDQENYAVDDVGFLQPNGDAAARAVDGVTIDGVEVEVSGQIT